MDDRQIRERTIRQIQDAVAQMFGLSTEELRTEGRSRNVAFPRQIAMYLAKQLTDASLPEIGQEFGGKHSTTVMHSIAKIHQLRAIDPQTTKAIETLLGALAVSLNGSKPHENHGDDDTYLKD
jgi:chromosomal replication initiator protein